jgi:hypothetical protein
VLHTERFFVIIILMAKNRKIGKLKALLVAWAHFAWLAAAIVLGAVIPLTGEYKIIGIVYAILTFGGWAIWYPGCVFTKWEKRIMREHGLPVYEDTYLVHYIYKFFGIKLSKRLILTTLLSYMILFVAVIATKQ